MRIRLTAALLFALPLSLVAQSTLRVDSLDISQPAKVAEIDLDKLKGQPARLSWSADGRQLYLQMMEGEFGMPPKKLSHHAFDVENGKRQTLEGEPEWSTAYWTEKSGQASPDDPSRRIELKEDIKTEKTVNTPMGGALARGGTADDTGGVTGDAIASNYNKQSVRVITTTLGGTTIGVFEGMPLVPGRTFGWGPKGTGAIAFAEPKSGRVVLMDDRGQKRELTGTKEAILPAWAPDASKIAWLQKDGKKKYVLHVARVTKS